MSAIKQDLYKLIDILPEGQTEVAKRFLEFLIEKADQAFLQALNNVPFDDEPLSDNALTAITQAKEDIKCGNVRPLSDFIKELDS
jgi:hypothetical protein